MTVRTVTPALVRLLAELPDAVPIARIERAWVFPPRTVGEVESGLVVLALLPEEARESDQREVVTVQYEVRSGKGKGEDLLVREVTSRGWAPSERVPPLIAGVLRRLGGEEEEPRSDAIEGDPERWNRFLQAVSEGTVDPANG